MQASKQLDLFEIAKTEVIKATHEYSFLIDPSDMVKADIRALKEALNMEVPIGDKNMLSIPHISLLKIHFVNNDQFMIDHLTETLAKMEAFTVKLSGVNFFTHGRKSNSLYVPIANAAPIKVLFEKLLTSFRLKKANINPHLTLAKEIPSSAFSKIKSIQAYSYFGEFNCQEISLLKKRVNVNERYTLVTSISLK